MTSNLSSYIQNLPIDEIRSPLETGLVSSVDIGSLPNGIVTGSNVIQFDPAQSSELKTAVALSLLAAQRVAQNDPVITTPDEWLQRHNSVLRGLNWLVEGESRAEAEFKSINLAVHEAILPFLATALGPAAAAGSLIVTALEQLKTMDEKSKWITLFDKEARRFDVTEYHFAATEVVGSQTRLSMAVARFNAKFGRTQVLFFKLKKEKLTFDAENHRFLAENSLLESLNEGLGERLKNHTKKYIQSLDFGDV